MRAFVVVFVVATVLGGFVGGELMGATFSLTGAVVGGVGTAAVLLGLGAFFHAQEEKKRKKDLPPEMRAVFDRMIGRGQPPPAKVKAARRWTPRPFHANTSKDQVLEWFAHVEPWNRLDPRLLRVLTDRLYGNQMFELFVHASQDSGVIAEYVPLRALFDKGVGDVAACPQVAQILVMAGAKHAMSFAALVGAGKIGDDAAEKLYGNAVDCCEAAIYVEPSCLPGHLQLARLKKLIRKTDEAAAFCKRGLAEVERMKRSPMSTARPDMMGRVHEIEGQLRTLMGTLQA
jgi:hypothetical protein